MGATRGAIPSGTALAPAPWLGPIFRGAGGLSLNRRSGEFLFFQKENLLASCSPAHNKQISREEIVTAPG
jgi:hypothetical protein